jgi:ParB/RepB/Spo0J family partition protein
MEDRTFVFRATIRTADLRASIAAEGQQIPIVVRPQAGAPAYQIISGFRRATAMRELGLDTIAAIVRDDLADDEAALRAAIIENEQRQSYSDIDRAIAIISCDLAGWSGVDVAELMGLGVRQRQNLKRLLTLPEPIIAAIDSPDHHCGATHGIELGRLVRRYPQLDLGHWIARVDAERLSVARMKREVSRACRPPEPPRLRTIFNDKATDKAKGVFRFDAVKVVVSELDEGERAQLQGELTELLEALGRYGSA